MLVELSEVSVPLLAVVSGSISLLGFAFGAGVSFTVFRGRQAKTLEAVEALSAKFDKRVAAVDERVESLAAQTKESEICNSLTRRQMKALHTALPEDSPTRRHWPTS